MSPKIFSIGVLLVLVFSFFRTHPCKAQDNPNLSSQIQIALDKENLTGAVWSFIDSKGEIVTGATGLKNEQSGTLLSPESKVHVGSITKTLLAVGILRLVTEGKLNLDDPVAGYLPEIDFINPWNAESPIRLRHLMDHTSGLSDLRLWQIFSQSALPDDPLGLAFSRDKNVLEVFSRPGDFFSYSNMGYTLLGMIIEKVTGNRYEDFLDESLLVPMGMVHSTFHFVSQDGEYWDPSLAYGHLDGKKPVLALPVFLRPAAQFTTTAKDMGIFIQFLLNEGKLGDRVLVRADLIQSMGNPHQTLSKKKGLNNGYGLGAAYRDRNGVLGKAHSGNIVGYHAMLYWFPEQKTGFFISHNMDSETADYEKFNRILISHLGLKNAPRSPITQPLESKEDWAGYYIPNISKVSPFAYLDFAFGFVKVEIEEESMILSPFLAEAKTLNHLGDGIFQQEGRVKESHVAFTGQQGEKFISDGISNLKKVKTEVLGLHWISSLLGTLSLLGILILVIFRPAAFFYYKAPLVLFYPVLGFIPLFVSIPFFLFQPFVALGDISPASVLVFIGTGWFPFGLGIAVFQILGKKTKSRAEMISLTLVFFALQWICILIYWSLIPFRLWL